MNCYRDEVDGYYDWWGACEVRYRRQSAFTVPYDIDYPMPTLADFPRLKALHVPIFAITTQRFGMIPNDLRLAERLPAALEILELNDDLAELRAHGFFEDDEPLEQDITIDRLIEDLDQAATLPARLRRIHLSVSSFAFEWKEKGEIPNTHACHQIRELQRACSCAGLGLTMVQNECRCWWDYSFSKDPHSGAYQRWKYPPLIGEGGKAFVPKPTRILRLNCNADFRHWTARV